MQTLRHLSPQKHDRVLDLLEKEPCDEVFVKQAISVLQMIQTLNSNQARIKFETFLDNVEKHILKRNGFNMLIRNVPRVAQLCDDQEVPIKYVHMRETLKQYGDLVTFHMIRGTVYVKFSQQETCVQMHSKINNMMMGSNILSTEVL